MASKRYRHFIIRAEHSPSLSEVLLNISKAVENHEDDDGPYHHVEMEKFTTVNRMKKLSGCDQVTGVMTDQDASELATRVIARARQKSDGSLLEVTESNVARAMKEYEALLDKMEPKARQKSNGSLLEVTRSSVARAKKEYEALLEKGKVLVQVLNEDNTPEDVLSATDQRALRAYKKSLK